MMNKPAFVRPKIIWLPTAAFPIPKSHNFRSGKNLQCKQQTNSSLQTRIYQILSKQIARLHEKEGKSRAARAVFRCQNNAGEGSLMTRSSIAHNHPKDQIPQLKWTPWRGSAAIQAAGLLGV